MASNFDYSSQPRNWDYINIRILGIKLKLKIIRNIKIHSEYKINTTSLIAKSALSWQKKYKENKSMLNLLSPCWNFGMEKDVGILVRATSYSVSTQLSHCWNFGREKTFCQKLKVRRDLVYLLTQIFLKVELFSTQKSE
jgi:hypothetical protein